MSRLNLESVQAYPQREGYGSDWWDITEEERERRDSAYRVAVEQRRKRREAEMYEVGTIVKLKQEYLGNKAGTIGVVFNNYGDGAQVIFENGEYDGFSFDRWLKDPENTIEVEYFLERVGVCPELAGYQFRNVMQVSQDFNRGVFDAVLKNREQWVTV